MTTFAAAVMGPVLRVRSSFYGCATRSRQECVAEGTGQEQSFYDVLRNHLLMVTTALQVSTKYIINATMNSRMTMAEDVRDTLMEQSCMRGCSQQRRL